MKKVSRNECDFSDVFHYAEKEFGIHWNTCNDIFFREELLNYKSYDDLYLDELEGNLEDTEYPITDENVKKGTEVLISYMKSLKVKELRVYNG